jgi:hypothetical protein
MPNCSRRSANLRVRSAANRLRLGPGCDREQIEAIVHGCVRHAGLRETYVRVTWLNAAGRRYAGQVTGLTATAP